jgi:hypothetical protein
MALKHVGRIKKSKKKVVVAYRVVPQDAEHCLVVPTEALMAEEHDALMKAVESNAGQNAYEFAEAMMRTQLPDGRNMLVGFHQTGRLQRYPTTEIEMTPDSKNTVGLDELNRVIAEQKGVSVEDLALSDGKKPKPTPEVTEEATTAIDGADFDTPPEVMQAAQAATGEVLSDEELAAKYRSDADRMFKEAKRLREQAEELVPTKKKTKESA